MLKLDKKSHTSQRISIEDIIPEIKNEWGNSFRFTENTIVIHSGTPDPSDSFNKLLKDISKRLKLQKKFLDHIYITCYSCLSYGSYMKELFSSISIHLPNIRGLTLNITTCPGLPDSRDFSYNLCKTLGHLERLELNFFNLTQPNQQTDKDLKMISSKICKNMPNLKRLVLGFSGNNVITGKGVKNVIKQINNYQRQLEELSLSFTECELISDEAFDWNLSLLSKKLKRFALNFSLCQDITEEGLCALGTSISNASWPNLRQLSLQFQNCYLISKEGPEVFVSMLTENLRQLRFLKLNFSWIVKLNDKTLDSICQAIKEKLMDLQELCLDLSCCSRLTQKTRKGLNERLNFIPLLTLTL